MDEKEIEYLQSVLKIPSVGARGKIQSNLLPNMQNTLRYNINAYEDDFWKNHNQYKLTPHIDFLPKYTPPYYAPQETGFGSFNYQSYKENLKRF